MQSLLEDFTTHRATGGTFEEFVRRRAPLSTSDLLFLIGADQRANALVQTTYLESYLENTPQLAHDPEALMEAIYAEMLIREEHREALTVDEYVTRFPKLESTIRRQFQLHKALGIEIESQQTLEQRQIDNTVKSEGVEQVPQPQFDDIEIIRLCGRGGMASVYHGRNRELARDVAIKTLSKSVAPESSEAKRMEREAKAVASLDHQNIVKVYDVRRDARGLPVIIMEFVDGGTLAHRVAMGPMETTAACAMMIKIASGVAVAHQSGLIHRDLKPANILLSKEGEPKVADFGLVRADMPLPLDASSMATFVGTPSYVAPEQARGEHARISSASDVYSLGVILYELLTGRPPFQAATVWEVVSDIISADATQLRQLNRRIPIDLETICHKCLEKLPENRYQNASELHDDLVRFYAGRPIHALPVSKTTRVIKWCRRNPTTAGLSLLLVVALAATALVASVSQRRVQAALGKTEEALTNAASQRDVAVSAMNDLVFTVHDTLSKREASIEARGEVLQSAMLGLQKIIDNAPEDVETLLTMADAHNRYAFILTQKAKFDEAIAEYQKAIAIAEAQPAGSTTPADKPQRLAALFYQNFAQCYLRMAQFDKAIAQSKKSTEVIEPLLKEQPKDIELRRLVCLNKQRSAEVLSVQGATADALATAEQARAIALALFEELPEDLRIAQLLIDVNRTIGESHRSLGNLAGAEEAFQSIVELLDRQEPASSEDVQVRTRYYNAIAELAFIQLYRMNYADANEGLGVASAGFSALVDAEPERAGFRLRMANVQQKLTTSKLAIGDFTSAMRHARETIKQYSKAIELDSTMNIQMVFIAVAWEQIANMQLRDGDLQAAFESTMEVAANIEPISERFQMQDSLKKVKDTIEVFSGALGNASSFSESDIGRIQRAFKTMQLTQKKDIANLEETEVQLQRDIDEADHPLVKEILLTWLTFNLGQKYQVLANSESVDQEELAKVAIKCLPMIKQLEGLPGADATFHLIEPSFIGLRSSSEFLREFPVK